ncbi:thiamine diphosphokinase [soil metagenome]
MKIGKKVAIILCNGEPPYKYQLSEYLDRTGLFIAADGGGNVALEFKLEPDVIIGDLDSFSKINEVKCPVIKNPDQNTNDLEKALAYALQMQSTSAIVFGATGRRVDQTVKNLSVMKQFNDQFDNLIFKDRYSDIKLIASPHSETLPLNTSVSLFPLSGTVSGVSSKGLKYQLQNDTLENGVFDGSSNETIEPVVEITYKSGDLLLFINHNID